MIAMSQMELDFCRRFRERLVQCSIDTANLCQMGSVDPRAAPAIIASECLAMAARITAEFTDLPLDTWLQQCRRVFEAAKKEEAES